MTKEKETIRPSQLIYQSGPGAILDLLNSSVMVLAADKWNTYNAPKENDKRITQVLKVDHVRILNENSDKQKIRAINFPKWKICPSCNRMTQYNNENCYFCEKQKGEKIALYPSRFVIACIHGHISDFPYNEWVHQERVCSHASDEPKLMLIRDGHSGSLSDLSVRCIHCNARKSLGKIMKPDEDQISIFKCTGEEPWLNKDKNSDCTQTMRTFLRGASNIYSPSVLSFLQVPLTSSDSEADIQIRVQMAFDSFKEAYDEDGEIGLKYLCKQYQIDPSFVPFIIELLTKGALEEVTTYESIRKQEWNTLIQPYVNDVQTKYQSEKVEVHKELKPYFSAIHRVDSVPEVQVLQGFNRIEYVDRFDDNTNTHLSSVMSNSKENWLPAVRNFGEGLFFVFDKRKLADWERKDEVTSKIVASYNEQRKEFGNSKLELLPRHLLIHSFSHALLKELAAHSGYSTTSLKERLYCGTDMHGLLIYTASGDSEGSLGGLTQLVEAEKLFPIIIRALERMQYCSSDPNCSDGTFKYHSTANGAACHSCSFVSETSCEWGNQLLDRRLLLNINPNQHFGYFDELLNDK